MLVFHSLQGGKLNRNPVTRTASRAPIGTNGNTWRSGVAGTLTSPCQQWGHTEPPPRPKLSSAFASAKSMAELQKYCN